MPLSIVREDITKMQVDVIVNSTNEEMIGYSGVDLAIHNAAGEELASACMELAPLGLGMAVMTDGFRLPAKHIIHTSGPIYRDGLHGEQAILRSCYLESLRVAQEAGLSSIAFPLISSGAYGYPKEQVLTFAVQTISEYLQTHEMMVYLCVYDRTSYTFSKQLFDMADRSSVKIFKMLAIL
jgi:O-acetyl-ADP-ribose deacetylase (regulator of RNase III)